MPVQDKWCDKVWTINHAEPAALKAVLVASGGQTQFTLDPILDGVHTIGYRVLFASGQMTPAWDPPCRLFRFGVDAPAYPSFPSHQPHLPLPPWDSSNASVVGDYGTVAAKLRDGCVIDPNIERLVGEISVNGRREIVTLYQLDNVISGDHSFLVIAVQSKDSLQNRGSESTRESGIAHGNN